MRTQLLLPLFLIVLPVTAYAEDWPEFLGAGGAAKSTDAIPTEWSESKNMVWQVDLPGSGSSSPIVAGDRLFLTCDVERELAPKKQLLCFDKRTGDFRR